MESIKQMKTLNIRGKEYVMVNERIKAFRNNFKDFKLTTEILEISDKHCLMVAKVIDKDGNVVANGYARETVDKCQVNKFAYVENCETSAVGRALGFFGIGVDTAICSAEELNTKLSYDEQEQPQIQQQETKAPQSKVVPVADQLKKRQANVIASMQKYKGQKLNLDQYMTIKNFVEEFIKEVDEPNQQLILDAFNECCLPPAQEVA